jgi:hypothetical protein
MVYRATPTIQRKVLKKFFKNCPMKEKMNKHEKAELKPFERKEKVNEI